MLPKDGSMQERIVRSCSYWACMINMEAICNQTNGYMPATIIIRFKYLCIDCIVWSLNKIWGFVTECGKGIFLSSQL